MTPFLGTAKCEGNLSSTAFNLQYLQCFVHLKKGWQEEYFLAFEINICMCKEQFSIVLVSLAGDQE